MRSAFLVTLSAVLALAACQKKPAAPPAPEPPAPVAQTPPAASEQMTLAGAGARELAATREGETPSTPVAECDPKNKGAVSLTTNGAPGDSFKITLTCGAVVVATCTATIPAGAAIAHCSAGPNPEPAGAAACTLASGMRNTPGATPNPYGCAY
jgi:hypothetical protein